MDWTKKDGRKQVARKLGARFSRMTAPNFQYVKGRHKFHMHRVYRFCGRAVWKYQFLPNTYAMLCVCNFQVSNNSCLSIILSSKLYIHIYTLYFELATLANFYVVYTNYCSKVLWWNSKTSIIFKKYCAYNT